MLIKGENARAYQVVFDYLTDALGLGREEAKKGGTTKLIGGPTHDPYQ